MRTNIICFVILVKFWTEFELLKLIFVILLYMQIVRLNYLDTPSLETAYLQLNRKLFCLQYQKYTQRV